MAIITEEAVHRRLQDVRNISQEAIETISLWIMHYKDKQSIDIIVEGWLSCFKTASSDQQRVALFYIMNDVVQRAKNKHIDTLIPVFQPAVLAAVQIGRKFPEVKSAMERCLNIFGERQVFTKDSVHAMKNLLQNSDVMDSDDLCVELGVLDVAEAISNFQKGRDISNSGMETLRAADFDFGDHIKHNMKDRNEAAILESDSRRALEQIIAFRHAMETQKKKMLDLIETLELAKRQLSFQLREVTVAEDAYQKFYQGIRVVHNELKEMSRTGVFPGATPPRDAPSPTANDDIYATGVESALINLRVPGVIDNHDNADMEIGDEEDDNVLQPPPAPPNLISPSLMNVAPPPLPFNKPPVVAGSWAIPPQFSVPPPNTSTQPPPAPFALANTALPPPSLVQPNLTEHVRSSSSTEISHLMPPYSQDVNTPSLVEASGNYSYGDRSRGSYDNDFRNYNSSRGGSNWRDRPYNNTQNRNRGSDRRSGGYGRGYSTYSSNHHGEKRYFNKDGNHR